MSLLDKLTQLKSVLGIKDDRPLNTVFVDPVSPEDETPEPIIQESTEIESEFDITEMDELIADVAEKEEMDNEFDEGYLQYSAEVVGYGNRELQWNAYRTVISYIDSNSVVDFGCGRGDLQAFYRSEFPDNEPLDYIGVESNLPLVEAGTEIYPGINIIAGDWFNLDESIQRDWAVNVGSCNLRYDADLTVSDTDYTKNTIKKMYQHCTRGVVVLLTSDISGKDDGLINHNPGEFINWAQKEFSNVALDHSSGDDAFCLIIYK